MKKIIITMLSLIIYSYSLSARVLTEPTWVYIGEARRYIAENKPSLALELLNNVIAEYPENADAHYFLATVYEKEAGNPASPGGAAVYILAINEYQKTIQYAQNLSVPAYELDAYFNLLKIYENLIDNEKYTETEILIDRLAERALRNVDKGRIYFRLADYYGSKNQDILALKNYDLAYQNEYRQKIALFKTSLINRKMRDYVQEKSKLILANKYDFDYEEPINFDVQRAINARLTELQNVDIPKKFY